MDLEKSVFTKEGMVTKRVLSKKFQLFTALLVVGVLMIYAQPVFAAGGGDIWSKASELMKDIYTKILGISTICGIVCASIALLLMNFSKNGKTVDESRAWLKRIVIVYIILNSLGLIVSYITPLIQGGQWNG